jgi:hypothetical protein
MQNKISKKIFMVTIEVKIQLLINPTKTPKIDCKKIIFKLQKATQSQVLKVKCKTKFQTTLSWLLLKLKN